MLLKSLCSKQLFLVALGTAQADPFRLAELLVGEPPYPRVFLLEEGHFIDSTSLP